MTSEIDSNCGRQPLHTREIRITGFERDDGLYEVEGWLTDTKPFDFTPPSGGRNIAAGTPIHRMGVRLIYDESMTVRKVIAVGEALPYDNCVGGPATMQALVGLSMSRGWSAAIRERLSGKAGCAHLSSLMAPMAATAFQTMVKLRLKQSEKNGGFQPSVDSCIAYARDGELIRTQYPTLYLAKEPVSGR